MLPFFNLSNDILIKFRQQRISQLQGSINEKDKLELAYLKQQKDIVVERTPSSSYSFDNIGKYNIAFNTGNVILRSTETTRYFTSFIGHNIGEGANILTKVTSFGAKAGSFFAKFIPIVSTIVELGTQANNNQIIYNYEKKLKALELIDSIKTNLIVFEQQTVDYYINNVLQQLQSIILQSSGNSLSLLNQTKLLHCHRHQEIDLSLEAVRNEYYKNVDSVIQKVEDKYITTINEKDNLFYQQKKIHDKNIAEQKISFENNIKTIEKELSEKQNKIQELLNYELVLKTEIETEKKLLNKVTREKTETIDSLNRTINCLQREYQFNKETTEKQKESLRELSKAIEEASTGGLSDKFKIAYSFMEQQKNEMEKSFSISFKRANELELERDNLQSSLKTKTEIFNEEKEHLQVLNEQTITRLKKANESLSSLKKTMLENE